MKSARLVWHPGVIGVVIVFASPGLAMPGLQEHGGGKVRPPALPLSLGSGNGESVRHMRTSLQWKGREYDVDTGIDVLMSVVRDPEEPEKERHLALIRLAMFETQLRGRTCMEELVRLFDTASPVQKSGILLCFLASDDPRGIPLFVGVLDAEQASDLRLDSANGLARWNVRRGVAELMRHFDSTELQSGRFYPVVGDRARDLFGKLNKRKGWRFPAEEIRKSIEDRPGLDREEQVAVYTAEIKNWFAENEGRFPVWKLGDPLPEVPEDEAKASGDTQD